MTDVETLPDFNNLLFDSEPAFFKLGMGLNARCGGSGSLWTNISSSKLSSGSLKRIEGVLTEVVAPSDSVSLITLSFFFEDGLVVVTSMVSS